MDAFQQSAWAIFQTDPNRVLAVEAQINGKSVIRIAVATYVLCNQIGTHGLMEASTGDRDSFWSRLIWAETSGIWSPSIAKAS